MTSDSPTLAQRLRAHMPLVIVAIMLAIIFGGVFMWRAARTAPPEAMAPPPAEVTVLRVQTETLPQALDATGTLQAVREVVLAPEVAGRVVSIQFEAGQSVGAGAPILQLFSDPEFADRSAAVARAEFAALQLRRSRELAPTGAEPRELLQQRQAELAQARAAIQQLDARIRQRVVRAPFAGQLGVRRVNLGQYVNAGDPIATLTALDQLYVNFTVPQQELSRLRVGGTIAVRSDSTPGAAFTARINAIEPVVSGNTRNISVQAVMSNPGRALRPGLYVSVGVEQPAREGAILVPTTAIQTSASGDSVFVVRDGKAVAIPVTVGREVGDRTLVERGLSAGDVVITTGQVRLRPDAPVRATSAASAR